MLPMDAVTSALAGAWLEAVGRLQSRPVEQGTIPAADRTITDVIESALRHGGPDSKEPGWVDPTAPSLVEAKTPGALIDKRV
jgi:hypothetical protein